MDNVINFNAAAVYRIEIQERIDADWNECFGGFSVTHANGAGTILTGTVADQAALYGLIGRARNLGLTLVSLQRIENKFE